MQRFVTGIQDQHTGRGEARRLAGYRRSCNRLSGGLSSRVSSAPEGHQVLRPKAHASTALMILRMIAANKAPQNPVSSIAGVSQATM